MHFIYYAKEDVVTFCNKARPNSDSGSNLYIDVTYSLFICPQYFVTSSLHLICCTQSTSMETETCYLKIQSMFYLLLQAALVNCTFVFRA